MNLLLTCGGRRTQLVEAFQQALRGQGRVLVADCTADAPALAVADGAVITPDATHELYVDTLLEACREHRVGVLVPSLDHEVVQLSRVQDRFAAIGTRVVVSAPDVVDLCQDKLASDAFVERLGFSAPMSFSSVEDTRTALAAGLVRYPLIIKPRWGTTSQGQEVVRDDDELRLAFELLSRRVVASELAGPGQGQAGGLLLVQPLVDGVEYGLDLLNDLDGRYVTTFVRRKLRMRSGQTDRAVTVSHPDLEKLGETIARSLGHVGLMDCDLIVKDGVAYVLDLNPRIGGGYLFSHLAGADYCSALLAWAQGDPVDPTWFKVTPDVTVSKSDLFVRLDQRWPTVVPSDVDVTARALVQDAAVPELGTALEAPPD